MPLFAQNNLKIRIKDLASGEELVGVTARVLDSANIATISDSTGLVSFDSLVDGQQTIELFYLGYFKKRLKLTLPLKKKNLTDGILETILEASEAELEEITVISTRTKENIENIPTRVEVINQEEVEERSTDKPSDISHAVKEQPGVQIQRTSATSGTFNIRLQGLRGKYVQILKDGFPLFGGLSQNLSIAQIPPMDLRQIEIIKGPASTLYGGDAIAGVINLISKEPTAEPEYNFLLNVENTKSVDVAAFASQKIKFFGFSLMGQYRSQQAKDWDGDKFSDIPKLDRWSVSPQLYFYLNKRAKLNIGFNYSGENRNGGTLPAIENKITDTTYSYLETNKSMRLGSTVKFEYDLETKGKITFKNSFNYFDRKLSIFDYSFGGKQISSATELNYNLRLKKHNLVVGIDFRTDLFAENKDTVTQKRNYSFLTGGVFVQEVYSPNEKTSLEAGIRLDYNNTFKIFALPHAAWLQKWNNVVNTRVNFGMGYKLPTAFQDEAEEANYRNVYPIADGTKSELSLGGTVDLNVKVPNTKGVQVTINEMFFITHILNPLQAKVKDYGTFQTIRFQNANGFLDAKGLETSLRLSYRGFGFNFVYTLQDQSRKIDNVKSVAPLTSKHIISILAGYELPNRFSIGLDCYYYSPQQLSTGVTTQSIWEMGVNAQVPTKYIVFFANLENILDIRQTKFGPVVTPNPTYNRPKFGEIYAPLEGRILNVGFKIKLGSLVKTKEKD